MADPTSMTRVPLSSVDDLSWGRVRRGEPVTVGVPLARGLAPAAEAIGLEGAAGPVPVQVRSLDHWPDGSVKWALASFHADADVVARPCHLLIRAGTAFEPFESIQISDGEGVIRVATGAATFECAVGGSFPMSSVTAPGAPPRRTQLLVGHEGRTIDVVVSALTVHERGPLRAELEVRGRAAALDGSVPMELVATLELFAGLPTVRIAITLRNVRRARHRGGQWGLGDPGSILLDFAVLSVDLGAPAAGVQCAVESGAPLTVASLPLVIHQESSGGERWDGPIHRNREGRVPLRFRGYRATFGQTVQTGRRASPIVHVEAGGAETTAVVVQFWERFPSAIRVDGRTLELGLLPRQADDLHELQGGEQTTERIVLAFGPDRVSDPPLAWAHDPLRLAADPAWTCETGAVPFLAPARASDVGAYRTLAAMALDPREGFLAKREAADEYGWRNFGDLPADHESAFQPPDRPFVSHYNNQYDAVAAFARHFLRSGDGRWWRLMDDLARHVRDIDIYHTTEDKSAYNGGLFWHTAHYLDAGLSTHRTYPPGSPVSGGPSAEHNYNVGLMLHYFLTGERASREAAIGLGRWVIEMDDGRRTPFRWLASGPTGHASLTRDYHGPGRGAGHSILACLVAARLSGDRRFTSKADELIARVIHPADDIGARSLLDAERRWSYTAFLQVLGIYLHDKAERGEIDEAYRYAHASLLHYARWMADHERPYLERRDELEYPTETWVAQELRKADVFFWAALGTNGVERDRFLERGRFFFGYAVATLAGMPERRFTRPLVLVLANGLRMDWLARDRSRLPAATIVEPPESLAQPGRFVPQRDRAIRRAATLVILVGVAVVVAAVWLLSG